MQQLLFKLDRIVRSGQAGLKPALRNFCATLCLLLLTSTAYAVEPDELFGERFTWAEGGEMDGATELPTRVYDTATGMVLVLCRPGRFMMGAPSSDTLRRADEPQHQRSVLRPYYIADAEVDVGQFQRFVQASGHVTDAERGIWENGNGIGAYATSSGGQQFWSDRASWREPFPLLDDYRQRDDHPVVQVSFNDASAYAKFYGYVLPSEAQWEYAARSGIEMLYPWGNLARAGISHANVADQGLQRSFPAWTDVFGFDDGNVLLSYTRRFLPNRWELFDMSGNVREWCRDWYYEYPRDPWDERAQTHYNTGARVLRGGSWLDGPANQRVSARFSLPPEARRDYVGFRVVRQLPQHQF